MGASIAAWAEQTGLAAAHETSRTREARDHARRSEILTVSLHTAARSFGEFLEGPFTPRDYAQQYPPLPYASLAEMFGAEAVGHVIAAGVDQRLLEAKIPWDPESTSAPMGESLAYPGEAAQELGAELGRWAEELELRLPLE
jgi:hypothetical protein